jgi:hypothetical protein
MEGERPGADGSRGDLRAVRGAVLRGCVARPERLSRCTLPITALRVTPSAKRDAIWLALRPSAHSFFKSSTRYSVNDAFSTGVINSVIFESPKLHRLRSNPRQNSDALLKNCYIS